MKDIIWTIIIFWLIYKIIDVIKGFSKSNKINSTTQFVEPETKIHQTPADNDIKSAVKKHVNREGDYVDFEEIK